MLKFKPFIRSIPKYKNFATSTSHNYQKSRRILKTCLYGTILTSSSFIGLYIYERPQFTLTYAKHDDDELAKFRKWTDYQYNERLLHSSLFRFGRAVYTIVSVFIDYKYSLMGIDDKNEKYQEIKSQCHLRSAVKFKNLCSMNGGVFMKVGQHIGSLEFLFPKEYTDTLKCFQYEAPHSSLIDIRYVIESDTGKTLEELFNNFEEKPLGSASLAQVHKAELKTGEIVAVKVQHRSVKDHAMADEKVISVSFSVGRNGVLQYVDVKVKFFVGIASKIFPDFKFQWLVDQIRDNLPKELDFLNEGKNCEKMADILKNYDNLKVPKIYWEHSTKRVLFLEYVIGGYVDDVEFIRKHKLNVKDISTQLGQLYSEMIFVHGFIHCDPHPGNILVKKADNGNGTDIILLDHGLYQTMPNKVRLNYAKLWQCMIQGNVEGIREASAALGIEEYYALLACIVTGRTWDSIQSGIDKKKMTAKELNEVQAEAIKYVSVITEVLELLPREMILIFKTNDLLRGLDARLQTSATSASFITMAQCCLKALYHDELERSDSTLLRFQVHSRYMLNRFRLAAYQFTLTPFGTKICDVLYGKGASQDVEVKNQVQRCFDANTVVEVTVGYHFGGETFQLVTL